MIAPKKPKVMRKVAMMLAVTVRLRNSSSGRIGSARPRLDPHEDGAQQQPDRDEPTHLRVGPLAELLVRQADQQGHEGGREDGGAEVVDRADGLGVANRRQQPPQDDEGNDPERQVDEEDPVPADRVGQEAAQRRTDDRREREDPTEQPLVLAPLARAEEVADDGERDREDRAGAEALDAAEQDELPHLLAQAAQQRAGEEEADADHHHRPPPEQVGELAVDRPGHRGGQQVDGDHPHVELVALEVGHDARQGRADDRLVERGQEHREEDRAEDLHPARWSIWTGASWVTAASCGVVLMVVGRWSCRRAAASRRSWTVWRSRSCWAAVERGEQAGHAGAADRFHVADQAAALLGQPTRTMRRSDVVVRSLDDPALGERPDDAARVRERHADLIGEAAHRQRPLHLEEGEHLESDHRQPVCLASRRPRTPVVGEERRERVDDLGGARSLRQLG